MKHILRIWLAAALLWLAPFARAEGLGQRKPLMLSAYGGFSVPSNQLSGVSGKGDGFTGLVYGLALQYRVMAKVAIDFELLQVGKGYTLATSNNLVKYDLSYLELPIQIRWSPIPQLAFHGGPYLAGLVIAATQQSNGGSGSVKSGFSNDFGLTVGAWAGFDATKQITLGLDLRYDIGLANVLNDNLPQDIVHTRAFMTIFTFGLNF